MAQIRKKFDADLRERGPAIHQRNQGHLASLAAHLQHPVALLGSAYGEAASQPTKTGAQRECSPGWLVSKLSV